MRTSSRSLAVRAGVLGVSSLLLAAGTLAAAPPAFADTVCSSAPTLTWTGAGDGVSWTDTGNWDGANAPGADPFNLVIAPAAPATPGDPVALTINDVTGTACGLKIDKSASPTSAVTITLNGGLSIGADAAAPTVELGGASLTLAGGTSPIAAGTTVQSTNSDPNAQQPFGSFIVGADETLQPSGAVNIGSTATLQLVDGGTLDATTPSTLAQVQVGQGAFAWVGGTISGTLTDDVLTTLAGAGTRTIPNGSTLTNRNAIEVEGGTLSIAGQLVNGGILRLLKDVTVSGGGLLQNGPGVIPTGSTATTPPPALLAVGGQDDVSGTGTATINGVALHNVDQINVVAGLHLVLTGSQSWLHNNSSLTSPQPPTTTGPAVLQIGADETLALQGTTKLSKGFQLRVDDAADGTTSKLSADTSFGPVSVTATSPAEGTLAWASGAVEGPLTVNGAYAAITNSGSSSRRTLSTSLTASSSAPALTLAGNTTAPDSARTLPAPTTPMTLAQGARILVTGQADLAGPSNGMLKQVGTSGQSLTVASGAMLRRRPADPSPSTTTAPTETATIDVPIVNRGTVELDASLNASGGYTQQLQSGAPSTAARPLTALIGGSWLTAPTAIGVTAGGLGGKGTIHAPKLSLTGAWLGAGYRANCREVTSTFAESCIGVLRVVGALALSSSSDVQVVVRKETVNGKSTIAHDTVAVTGSAALNGTLTTATGSGYTPAYLTSVSHIVTFASRSGAFTRLLSPLAPVGYGWRPSYDDNATGGRGVNAQLVDTGPPVIGYAGLPAFTQQNVLEVHYAAHDNQTGVASYDVRWRRAGGADGAYGAWVAPKSWQHTTARFQVITGIAEGYTYCVQVRARDKAGNVSPWTAAPCTARELDDKVLRASGVWTRSAGHPGFYDSTYSRTTSAGATLSKYGTYTRIAVSAYRCPTCGTVKIYSGGTLVKTWNLASTKTGKVNWVSPVAKLKSARVRLVAVLGHKLVQIDALGLLR